MEATRPRSVVRRGLVHFILLTLLHGLRRPVLAGPAWWLLRDGAFTDGRPVPVRGGFSCRICPVACLARLCPAVRADDAYPRGDERKLLARDGVTGRSLTFAQHLTRENELFACGLPAGMALFARRRRVGPDGLGGNSSRGERSAPVGYAIYAVLLVPLVHLILVDRTLRAPCWPTCAVH